MRTYFAHLLIVLSYCINSETALVKLNQLFELYMIALIETAENGVHFSNTMGVNQPIRIEAININRNLRPRRSLAIQDAEIKELKAEKQEKEKKKEFENLEVVYAGVLEQWRTLKPSARRFHLKRAREVADLVPSAMILLEKFGKKLEVLSCQ